mmetsp:Transcript_17463/g.38046  ORF Transcript_17463/g.38046 Transcript_17463/m.38046 type:complete len:334 (+) Transcript_17463:136-1137(+)
MGNHQTGMVRPQRRNAPRLHRHHRMRLHLPRRQDTRRMQGGHLRSLSDDQHRHALARVGTTSVVQQRRRDIGESTRDVREAGVLRRIRDDVRHGGEFVRFDHGEFHMDEGTHFAPLENGGKDTRRVPSRGYEGPRRFDNNDCHRRRRRRRRRRKGENDIIHRTIPTREGSRIATPFLREIPLPARRSDETNGRETRIDRKLSKRRRSRTGDRIGNARRRTRRARRRDVRAERTVPGVEGVPAEGERGRAHDVERALRDRGGGDDGGGVGGGGARFGRSQVGYHFETVGFREGGGGGGFVVAVRLCKICELHGLHGVFGEHRGRICSGILPSFQ